MLVHILVQESSIFFAVYTHVLRDGHGALRCTTYWMLNEKKTGFWCVLRRPNKLFTVACWVCGLGQWHTHGSPGRSQAIMRSYLAALCKGRTQTAKEPCVFVTSTGYFWLFFQCFAMAVRLLLFAWWVILKCLFAKKEY